MTKWEYAAIVRKGHVNINPEPTSYTHNVERWFLVQPGEENHFILRTVYEGERGDEFTFFDYPWRDPPGVAKHYERAERYAKNPKLGSVNVNDANPKILFESTDILHLVNLAGAEGWEITGGLGLADGYHGHPETRWRMMRREL